MFQNKLVKWKATTTSNSPHKSVLIIKTSLHLKIGIRFKQELLKNSLLGMKISWYYKGDIQFGIFRNKRR